MNMPGSGSKARVMPACSAWLSSGSSARASRSIRASSSIGIGSAAGPERDAFGVEGLGQIDGTAEEVEADRAAGGIGVHQGRIVLHARVEQVARPGLDDACHPVPIEGGPNRIDLAAEDRRIFVGVESPGVERDRNALIALVGQEIDRVDQTMVCQAVGVVAESHGSVARGGHGTMVRIGLDTQFA